MIEFVCGNPGAGKGVWSTRELVKFHNSKQAKKWLKEANSLLPDDNQLGSLVFTNYPVLLDVKNKVYSNYITFDDMTIDPNRGFYFPRHAVICIDEAQQYYDSREFSKFPKKVGVFLQTHRHNYIDRIIIITQDPSRVDTKIRAIAEKFTKIARSRFIFGIAFMRTQSYFRFDDYGKPCPPKSIILRQPVQSLAGGYYDYERKSHIFLTHKVFRSYDSRYCKFLFDRLPLKPFRPFTNKYLTAEDVDNYGIYEDVK